jgi:hypothetical protein
MGMVIITAINKRRVMVFSISKGMQNMPSLRNLRKA